MFMILFGPTVRKTKVINRRNPTLLHPQGLIPMVDMLSLITDASDWLSVEAESDTTGEALGILPVRA